MEGSNYTRFARFIFCMCIIGFILGMSFITYAMYNQNVINVTVEVIK